MVNSWDAFGSTAYLRNRDVCTLDMKMVGIDTNRPLTWEVARGDCMHCRLVVKTVMRDD